MIEVYGCREDDGSEPDIQLEAGQGGQLQCPEEKGELKRQPRERAEESAQEVPEVVNQVLTKRLSEESLVR